MRFLILQKWLLVQIIVLWCIGYFLNYKPHYSFIGVRHHGPLPSTFFSDFLAGFFLLILFICCLANDFLNFFKEKKLIIFTSTAINVLFVLIFFCIDFAFKKNKFFSASFKSQYSNYSIQFNKDSTFMVSAKYLSLSRYFPIRTYQFNKDTFLLNVDTLEIYNEAIYKKYFLTKQFLIPIKDGHLYLDSTEFLYLYTNK
jgi:hypothetical protein